MDEDLDQWIDAFAGADPRKPTRFQLTVELGKSIVHLEKTLDGLEMFHPRRAKKLAKTITYLHELRDAIDPTGSESR